MLHITRKDLASCLANKHNLSAELGLAYVETVLAEMHQALVSGKGIELRNFGTFNRVVRCARKGRNPKVPGSACAVPRRYAIKFKLGKSLREALAREPVPGAVLEAAA
jgi:integration host factor subunit beta